MATPTRQRLIALCLALVSVVPLWHLFAWFLGGTDSALKIARAVPGFAIGPVMLALIWMVMLERVTRIFLAALEGTSYALPGPIQTRLWYGALFPLMRTSFATTIDASRMLGRSSLVWLAGLLGALGALSLNGIVEIVTNRPIVAPAVLDTWGKLVVALLVLVALIPLLETLVMAGVLKLLGKLWKQQTIIAVVSALAWGVLHAAANHPAQFPAMVWLFWILSMLYLRLRGAHGFRHAFVGTFLAHALNNAIAVAVIVIGQRVA
jgi:hypothetical protein